MRLRTCDYLPFMSTFSTTGATNLHSEPGAEPGISEPCDYDLATTCCFISAFSTTGATHPHLAKYRAKHLRTKCLRTVEPYGALPWFCSCLLLGIQNIGRRFRTRSHAALDPKCFIPEHHTHVREIYLLASQTVQIKASCTSG